MLVSKKWLSQTALVSALALHGLAACSSDPDQQEGVSEEVGEASSDDSAAAADDKAAEADEKPEASVDVLAADDDAKPDESGIDGAKMLQAEPPAEAKAAAPATAPTPAPAAMPATAAGRSVYYVKSERTSLRDQPADSGKEIGELHKGDSVVAEVDGEWAKTSAAKFISVKDLSTKPIGRDHIKRDWDASGAASGKKSH